MRVLFVVLLGFLASCGAIEKNCGGDLKRECDNIFGHDYDERSQDNANDISKLQTKVDNIQSLVDAHDVRISMLEVVSELHATLISLNTNAVNNILIPGLQDLQSQLLNLQIDVNQSLSQIQLELSGINNTIHSIQETVKQNDEYANIPGCEHSYFVLYSANGSIVDFYVTENDGTVNGAWQLQNNTNYNLAIDGNVVCTNVKIVKSSKKFYFNNGSSLEIDLSY